MYRVDQALPWWPPLAWSISPPNRPGSLPALPQSQVVGNLSWYDSSSVVAVRNAGSVNSV